MTKLLDHKKAKLVLIANEVDPLELVMWPSALCLKMGVAYAMVSGKAVGVLWCTRRPLPVCVRGVNPEDEAALNSLQESFTTKYAENKKWGGGIIGLKTQSKLSIRAAAIAAEKLRRLVLSECWMEWNRHW